MDTNKQMKNPLLTIPKVNNSPFPKLLKTWGMRCYTYIHLQYTLAADNTLVSHGVNVRKTPGSTVKNTMGSVGSTSITTWLLLALLFYVFLLCWAVPSHRLLFPVCALSLFVYLNVFVNSISVRLSNKNLKKLTSKQNLLLNCLSRCFLSVSWLANL